MVRVHGPTSMVQRLKKLVSEALGPSLGVNQTWTKKNGHALKSECAHFFKYIPKGKFWKEKKIKFDILFSSLGLPLSSLLVKCVEDVACKFSHNNFYKNRAIYFIHVQCNLHVTCTLCCHYSK